MTDNKSAGVGTLVHALDVIETFGGSNDLLGVNEISRRINLNKSTVSRILATFERRKYVEKDPESGKYALGSGLLRLAGSLLSRLSLVDIARPFLRTIAQETQETVTLSLWSESRHALIDVSFVPGIDPVKHVPVIGNDNPLHCTAVGKAVLAFLPESEIERLLENALERFTANTIVEPEKFRRELDIVRRLRYAMNNEERYLGVVGLAVPVLNIVGQPAGAVAVSMPAFRFNRAKEVSCADILKANAAAISQALGYSGVSLT